MVEQRTENPRVSGSTPLLGTTYEVVERNQVSSRMHPCKGGKASRVGAPKWRKGRRDSLKNCWGATPVSVRIRPSAPQIKNLTGLQQESMGIVDVNAGLCRDSTEYSAYANKSELLDQPV